MITSDLHVKTQRHQNHGYFSAQSKDKKYIFVINIIINYITFRFEKVLKIGTLFLIQ